MCGRNKRVLKHLSGCLSELPSLGERSLPLFNAGLNPTL
jgi:hypothetical protein